MRVNNFELKYANRKIIRVISTVSEFCFHWLRCRCVSKFSSDAFDGGRGVCLEKIRSLAGGVYYFRADASFPVGMH